MNTRAEGRRGEQLAARFLSKKGYKVVERNFVCRFGEIDIVALDGDTVVFTEVKYRKNDKFGMPREAVDRRKQKTIEQCAAYWLYKNSLTGVPTRFDVVELIGSDVNHFIDAFRS